ncbi:MAG: helix-turn-helix transcriptional regulator [Lachnospiraceae bacterium]|nr:helix-turn-helix transcriptional regulator [Lachnospiraceae bacterium]
MKILLKQIMEKRKLSARQVELITGLPKSTVSDICNGAVPRMDTMEILAAGFGLKINDLFESDYK